MKLRLIIIAALGLALALYLVTYVGLGADRKSTRLNSSHSQISYAVFCLKKKKTQNTNDYYPAHTAPRRHSPASAHHQTTLTNPLTNDDLSDSSRPEPILQPKRLFSLSRL